jgi:hypothetical protein
MMPWNWTVQAVKHDLGVFKYPGISDVNLKSMMPWFFANLDFIGNAAITEKVVTGIVDAVHLGEEKFDQPFGGYNPQSAQFGCVPLRPVLIGFADNRWIWTDGTSASSRWSAEDSFVAAHALIDDEIVLIYGYFNLEPVPNTLELWIQAGSDKSPIINIEAMRALGRPYYLYSDPIIIEPRSTLTILASTRSLTTATVEEAGLLAFQFCPKAKLITKEPTA